MRRSGSATCESRDLRSTPHFEPFTSSLERELHAADHRSGRRSGGLELSMGGLAYFDGGHCEVVTRVARACEPPRGRILTPAAISPRRMLSRGTLTIFSIATSG